MASRRFTGEAEADLCAAYRAGRSAQALADEHGTTRLTVASTIKRNGVAMRPAGGKNPRLLDDADEADVVRRYQGGETITAIGREFGTHYSRIAGVLRRRGVHLRPRSWKGGRTVDARGYVMVLVDDADLVAWPMATTNGYVMEHRLVMARHLGRPLRKSETVHHINGDRADNRRENLQLRSGNHGNGVVLRCAHCGSIDIEEAPLDTKG
jgi:transposase